MATGEGEEEEEEEEEEKEEEEKEEESGGAPSGNPGMSSLEAAADVGDTRRT